MKELKRNGSDYTYFMDSPSHSSDSQADLDLLPLADFYPEKYNNFFLYFYRHMTSYRRMDYFLRFQQENPLLEAELTALFSDVV